MKKKNNTIIKAHVIRGALYLLLLLAVCAIPFALAQRNANNRTVAPAASRGFNPSTAPPPSEAVQPGSVPSETVLQFPTVSSGPAGVSPLAIPHYPKAPQVVLYDQYDNASTVVSLSTTFTDFPTYSSDLADDFVVPAGQTWNVQSVDADGRYFNGPGPANSFNVFFYANNAGLPGAQVYSALNQPFSLSGTTFTVNLPTMAVLTEGTYWVEVQANMTFVPNGEWGWTDRTVQSNNPAAWQNPGGGFNLCPTWTIKTVCIPTAGGPDQVFRLNGTTGAGSPTPSPSATGSPSATATPTATASGTASPTATPSSTASPTASASATPSATATPTASPSATGSPSATPTATPSGTPSATPTPTGTPFACVRGQGYWKNHPDQWPVTELQLGNVTYTQEQLLAILHEPVRGNGLLILAHQLIAAKLNIAAGADPSCIQDAIAQADALIGDLVIPPIGDGYLAPRDVASLAGLLGRFNEGGMCAPACEGNPHSTPTPTPRSRPQRAPRPR
jgi:hypothetical protein